jgi:hypothetical protein
LLTDVNAEMNGVSVAVVGGCVAEGAALAALACTVGSCDGLSVGLGLVAGAVVGHRVRPTAARCAALALQYASNATTSTS